MIDVAHRHRVARAEGAHALVERFELTRDDRARRSDPFAERFA